MTPREQTCCFTGHRLLDQKDLCCIQATLVPQMRTLIQAGVNHFITGGAQGFDAIATQAVLALQKEYPYIALHLVLPYEGYVVHWQSVGEQTQQELLAQAASCFYCRPAYSWGSFHIRNRKMVDRSGYCISYLRPTATGGTVYTVNYAKKKGLHLYNLPEIPW